MSKKKDLDKINKKDVVFAASPTVTDIMLQSDSYALKDGEFVMKKAESLSGKTKPRIAFTEDPTRKDHYVGIYKIKKGLLPDKIIKEISQQNHLIAAILRTRGNMLSLFGHLRKDRFDIGLSVRIRDVFRDKIAIEDMPVVQSRIEEFTKKLLNCGSTESVPFSDRLTFADYLYLQTINGLRFGRFATEIIYSDNAEQSPETFHRFRVADAGTIFRTARNKAVDSGIREASIAQLENITGVKINRENFAKPDYAWIQDIDGTATQAFTEKEMVVYTLFPSSDIEHGGYPVTPLDTAIASVTTHISIETYNRLYFQNGRAAKGMLVVNSDEMDQAVIDHIKQQFNASINEVSNSFRTPIFGVNQSDKVTWVPTQQTSKDGEFQFLYDQVARNILSAFGMSPDELAGYNHLSRGTNQSSLNESSNEYKMTAARDSGLRPLIMKLQAFLNDYLFQIIDPELAQLCVITLDGLDAQSKDQEGTRLSTNAPLHYTYDQLMDEVDKPQIGQALGGKVPFNEYFHLLSDKYTNVGFLIAEMMGLQGAHFDPSLKYKRDAFYIQNLQLMMQANPGAFKALFASRNDAIDMLKEFIQEELDEDGEIDIDEEDEDLGIQE